MQGTEFDSLTVLGRISFGRGDPDTSLQQIHLLPMLAPARQHGQKITWQQTNKGCLYVDSPSGFNYTSFIEVKSIIILIYITVI
jgi:hypothetical protein